MLVTINISVRGLLEQISWMSSVLLVLGIGSGIVVFQYLPIAITIAGDILVVHYVFRKRSILNREISEIRLINRGNFLIIFNTELSLILNDKDSVILTNFNVGSVILYSFLTTWYQRASRVKLDQGKMHLTMRGSKQRFPRGYAALLSRYNHDQGN